MQVVTGMTREPTNHLVGLVGSVVIQYEVDLTGVRWNGEIDTFHEPEELLVEMTAVTLADYFACGNIQCREQRCRAVPFVIVSPLFREPRTHRQDRLRPIQRLNLRLLVNAQHNRMLWRIQIQ